MTPEEIQELRDLIAVSRPGTYETHAPQARSRTRIVLVDEDRNIIGWICHGEHNDEEIDHEMDLLVRARNLLPRLLDEIEELRRRLDEATRQP